MMAMDMFPSTEFVDAGKAFFRTKSPEPQTGKGMSFTDQP